MLITLDIKNESMKDSFLNFIKTLDYVDIKQSTDDEKIEHQSSKDKFKEFSGMWQDRNINQETLREKAWIR
ncbi:MAG: hypothetical protein PHF17_08490 [Arcobacteraceae bacterium]|jgi:hypothetical protein|nr:hypothetical protein [Arcobacteraceae bacterium]